MKIRGFEIIKNDFRKFPNNNINMPLRGSKYSAGYDFFSNEDIELKPGEKHIFWSDIKAYMLEGELLEIYVRSSIGIKRDLTLCNQTGIIDMDYYSNIKNDGNIGICLKNTSNTLKKIFNGERIAQGIFKKFLVSDNCNSEQDRNGGIGSTN